MIAERRSGQSIVSKIAEGPVGLMGVVNVTPDSFSDGGETFDTDAAIVRGLKHMAEGAVVVDVGGESTRPGATPVSPLEDSQRVVPVVQTLASKDVSVSVDTRHAQVMEDALDAGASIINDVTALEGDPRSIKVAAASDAAIVLMHMRGDPRHMNEAPVYDDVVDEVRAYLARRIEVCLAVGINEGRLIVDPGIGFGKTMQHNFELIENLEKLLDLGPPVLVGVSRKIGRAPDPQDRLAESIHWASKAARNGAALLRVHDVGVTAEALKQQGLGGW